MSEIQDVTGHPAPPPGPPIPPPPHLPPAPPYPAGAMGWDQQAAGPAPQLVVAPKNPAVSLLVSFFIPGVGSMINGDVAAGVAILVSAIVSWLLLFVLIGFILLPAVWVISLVHAYQGATRWNLQHGIVS
jgi:TM2 domain-containing membrane protein YozV